MAGYKSLGSWGYVMAQTTVSNPTRLWRDLYVAALFQPDPGKFAERIAEAEKALAIRARELFQAGGHHLEEEHAMDDTMRALKTLRYSHYGSQQYGQRYAHARQDSAKGDAALIEPLPVQSVKVSSRDFTSGLPAFRD